MKIISLGSGSKGNATLVEIDGKYLLIDNGFTLREIEKRLEVSPKDISAIFVTHEHSDHVEGVVALAKAYAIPVHAPVVLRGVLEERCPDSEIVTHADNLFTVDGIEVTPFRLPHDARYTVGYKFQKGEDSFATITDLGEIRPSVMENVRGVKAVLLESNYDQTMLRFGPYPEALKRRISGRLGHLSNDDASKFAVELLSSGTETIILGHVSENNNAPEIAYDTTAKYIEKNLNFDTKITLGVAEQNKIKIF